MDRVTELASARAVVVFTLRSCCMCHAVVSLLTSELGVDAAVHELDADPRRVEVERELARRLGREPPVLPAVFIGGGLVGSTDKVMSLHLGGKLVPLLKSAGAMWL